MKELLVCARVIMNDCSMKRVVGMKKGLKINVKKLPLNLLLVTLWKERERERRETKKEGGNRQLSRGIYSDENE